MKELHIVELVEATDPGMSYGYVLTDCPLSDLECEMETAWEKAHCIQEWCIDDLLNFLNKDYSWIYQSDDMKCYV